MLAITIIISGVEGWAGRRGGGVENRHFIASSNMSNISESPRQSCSETPHPSISMDMCLFLNFLTAI